MEEKKYNYDGKRKLVGLWLPIEMYNHFADQINANSNLKMMSMCAHLRGILQGVMEDDLKEYSPKEAAEKLSEWKLKDETAKCLTSLENRMAELEREIRKVGGES